MRWWRVAIGIFLGVGLMVAITSLYQMSLTGTMKKLGLAGSDFSKAVSKDELREMGVEIEAGWKCGLVSRVKGATQFLLAGDSQQGELSFRLGELRVFCGAGMMQAGEVESGTYEVAKGLGYLSTGYEFVLERGRVDIRVCENMPGAQIDDVMLGLLSSTTGRVHELLYEEWGKVIALQEKVDQICLDSRNSRR